MSHPDQSRRYREHQVVRRAVGSVAGRTNVAGVGGGTGLVSRVRCGQRSVFRTRTLLRRCDGAPTGSDQRGSESRCDIELPRFELPPPRGWTRHPTHAQQAVNSKVTVPRTCAAEIRSRGWRPSKLSRGSGGTEPSPARAGAPPEPRSLGRTRRRRRKTRAVPPRSGV